MSITLQKGQQIALEQQADRPLTNVVMGLGWDAAKSNGFFGFTNSRAIDLDASCILFDESKQLVDVVWYCQLRSRDGSVVHSGDNRTGAGDGDDECITLDLRKVPPSVQSIVFTVNSFTGQTFAQVENAYCRLVNASDNAELARFNLTVKGDHNAQIMAKLSRQNGCWAMQAIGENGRGRTFDQLIPDIKPHL